MNNTQEANKEAAPRTAKLQHALLLIKFLFFQVILVTADIATDIWAGCDLLFSRSVYGYATIFLIFAPMLMRVILTIANFGRCFHNTEGRLALDPRRFYMWKHGLTNLVWDFPLLQPVRYQSCIWPK